MDSRTSRNEGWLDHNGSTDVSTTPLYLGSSTPITMYVPVVQLGFGRGTAQGGRTPGTVKAAAGASVHSHIEALRG